MIFVEPKHLTPDNLLDQVQITSKRIRDLALAIASDKEAVAYF